MKTELVDQLFEGVYYVDKERLITGWNQGAQDISGFKAEEVVHRHCFENILNHVDQNGVALCFNGCPLHATIADGITRKADVYLQHKDGHRVPVTVKAIPLLNQKGEIDGAIEIFTEINNDIAFKSNLERLQKEVTEDGLTKIPNRKYLWAMIESKLREYKAVGVRFGINFIDIDNFKHVNDTYGHPIGDEVLKLLVKTVVANLRKHDVIGRLGGEEFVIVYSDLDAEGLVVASEKIRKIIEASHLRMKSGDQSITVSVGASLANDQDTVEDLIQRADNLMYVSKKNGKNRVTYENQ